MIDLEAIELRWRNFRDRLDDRHTAGRNTGYPCHLAGMSAGDVPTLLAEIKRLDDEVAKVSYGDARAAVEKTRLTDQREAALQAELAEARAALQTWQHGSRLNEASLLAETKRLAADLDESRRLFRIADAMLAQARPVVRAARELAALWPWAMGRSAPQIHNALVAVVAAAHDLQNSPGPDTATDPSTSLSNVDNT